MTIDSAKKACIFCSGELKNSARVKRIAGDCDLLIAVNGGTKHFVNVGLRPKVIIGDMDSNTNDMRNDETNIVRIPYPPYSDKSDVELAVEYALKQGCQEILLVAAVGGRFDHTLGNVALVAGNPGRIAILDGASTLVAVDKSEKCMLHGHVGTPVSLIPYGSGPFTVRTKGLKCSLVDESLHSATHGLSNELSQTQACVCVSSGVLLVYIENEDVSFKTLQ
ncbi:MAG: thiamine diphosphokinase [Sedimentisphaerales bacterium]|nr:thiamine diphosphokinase [Sedimentisphaerales bacterium]